MRKTPQNIAISSPDLSARSGVAPDYSQRGTGAYDRVTNGDGHITAVKHWTGALPELQFPVRKDTIINNMYDGTARLKDTETLAEFNFFELFTRVAPPPADRRRR